MCAARMGVSSGHPLFFWRQDCHGQISLVELLLDREQRQLSQVRNRHLVSGEYGPMAFQHRREDAQRLINDGGLATLRHPATAKLMVDDVSLLTGVESTPGGEVDDEEVLVLLVTALSYVPIGDCPGD